MDRIVVTSTNMIDRIVSAFPGYEEQPADAFSTGHWPVEYMVDVSFPDGRGRTIYVVENTWTAGAAKYTPLTLKWDELLLTMTASFFRRDLANMDRLSQAHEATTLIVGPCDMTNGRSADLKGRQQSGASLPPAPQPSNPTP